MFPIRSSLRFTLWSLAFFLSFFPTPFQCIETIAKDDVAVNNKERSTKSPGAQDRSSNCKRGRFVENEARDWISICKLVNNFRKCVCATFRRLLPTGSILILCFVPWNISNCIFNRKIISLVTTLLVLLICDTLLTLGSSRVAFFHSRHTFFLFSSSSKAQFFFSSFQWAITGDTNRETWWEYKVRFSYSHWLYVHFNRKVVTASSFASVVILF